jgi:hypothetical protein
MTNHDAGRAGRHTSLVAATFDFYRSAEPGISL